MRKINLEFDTFDLFIDVFLYFFKNFFVIFKKALVEFRSLFLSAHFSLSFLLLLLYTQSFPPSVDTNGARSNDFKSIAQIPQKYICTHSVRFAQYETKLKRRL